MSVTIEQIIAEDARFCANVSVTLNRRLGTVCISDDLGYWDDIFMQGNDADGFYAELDELCDQAPDVTFDDVAKHLSRQYVETLWH